MKIKIKRIICFIIATVMLCSPMENVTWCNNNVYADTISRNAIDEISTMKTRGKLILVERRERLYSGNRKTSAYKSVAEAATGYRKQLLNHQYEVNAYVKSTNAVPAEVFDELESQAFKVTSKGDEGDYMYWDIDREYPSYTRYTRKEKKKIYYYYHFRTEVWYLTTLEQKKQVDAKVKEIISQLEITEETTDYEVIKMVYDYVCEHVKYSDSTVDEIVYTSWSALFRGNAVCQGYAQLMYRILKELGISVRVIAGFGSHNVRHGWNIVKLGDYYYNLDSTWDAELIQNGIKYRYFLKGDNFNKHTRLEEYKTMEFYNVYPMAQNEYNVEPLGYSLKTRSAFFAVKKAKFKKVARKKVTFVAVTGAKGYQIQYATDKKFKKGKKTAVTSKVYFKPKNLKKKKKYYVRFRAYKIINENKVYTNWSSVKEVKRYVCR